MQVSTRGVEQVDGGSFVIAAGRGSVIGMAIRNDDAMP